MRPRDGSRRFVARPSEADGAAPAPEARRHAAGEAQSTGVFRAGLDAVGARAAGARRAQPEPGEEGVDQRRRGRGEVVGRRVEHPLVHHADHERVQRLRRERVSVSGGSCPRATACRRRPDRRLHAAAVVLVPVATDASSPTSSLVEDDVEHAARAVVGAEPRQRADAERAQRRQRIDAGAAARAVEHRLHRQRRALAHRVEQVGLVAEVPVDGAARHARRRRDFGERRARHAALAKHALGGVEQRLAGRLAASSGHCGPMDASTPLQTFMNVCNRCRVAIVKSRRSSAVASRPWTVPASAGLLPWSPAMPDVLPSPPSAPRPGPAAVRRWRRAAAIVASRRWRRLRPIAAGWHSASRPPR